MMIHPSRLEESVLPSSYQNYLCAWQEYWKYNHKRQSISGKTESDLVVLVAGDTLRLREEFFA